MRSKLVIVGGVAAGMSAASKARRTDPDMEIAVYEKSGYVSYGACGLPYFVQGLIPRHTDLIARTPEQFAKQRIQVFVHHEVMQIDPTGHRVTVKNLTTGESFVTRYDHLMLSTGGYAVRPPIPGLAPSPDNLFVVRSVEDGIAIRRYIEAQKPQRAVVIGAGYIGLEMTEALVAGHGLDVTVLTLFQPLLPTIDTDMAEHVSDELDRQGVALRVSSVQSFERENKKIIAAHTDDTAFPADLFILAAGVRPNTALAQAAGIAVGPTGAIRVDDRQRTNIEGIFSGGDVAEALDLVTGIPAYVPLGTTANKQGRVAGENIAGGNAVFHGIVGTTVVKVFDLDVARSGLTEAQARDQGYDVRTAAIKTGSVAHYMPGNRPLNVKLVYEASGRVLGAQMVGTAAAKRIDIVAAALYGSWKIDDLRRLDLSYAPPFAPVWDALLIAANVARV